MLLRLLGYQAWIRLGYPETELKTSELTRLEHFADASRKKNNTSGQCETVWLKCAAVRVDLWLYGQWHSVSVWCFFSQHAYALELLHDQLYEGAKALDVGSGSGILSACFARMVSHTRQVDTCCFSFWEAVILICWLGRRAADVMFSQ